MDLKEQYEKLLKYCYMKMKDRNLAEDIVQETFLRFWQSKSYRDTGKEMAYLYTIARNLCMDEYRKPKTEEPEQWEEIPDTVSVGPEERIEQIVLEEALDRLPEELREIVMLRYTNEMQVVDIAGILGISRFAVHRKIKEGLSRLREVLKEE